VKILNILLIAIITLLSIAAGFAKVMETPQEVEFLQSFGFNTTQIIVYGFVQIGGGVLLALPKTIRWGALITILAFLLSSALIIIDGDLMFGLISLVPVLLTALIYWQSRKIREQQ
jgi:uncharacterized membrane protein YphA (DoxX/SURF4 family)